jgi:hypothetical protein
MKTYQIHGEIKKKASGECWALIRIEEMKGRFEELKIIRASSGDLLFDGIRKFFEEVEKKSG